MSLRLMKINDSTQRRLVRWAYFTTIEDCLKERSVAHISIDGYESDKQRVHFTYGGKKCILYGVHCPNTTNDWENPECGILKVDVLATNDGVKDIWELPMDINKLRVDTLEKIACEIYDCCKDADWEDWECYKKEAIAGEFDNYVEFMSYLK